MGKVKEKEDKIVGMFEGKATRGKETNPMFNPLNYGDVDAKQREEVLDNIKRNAGREDVVHPTSPDWLHTFIPISEEKGAKDQHTNSENFHRHHKELSKVISQLQAEIEDLKFFKRVVMSRYPETYWCRVEKYIKRLMEQEEKIKQEKRKLEVLKKERNEVHYH